MKQEPAKIFIAYARKDNEMLEELREQFTPLEKAEKITVWYDGEIRPGEKWNEKIQEELLVADIILLLVSPSSISSKYFYESEVQKAIDRHENGETRVIPVILRECMWEETPIGKIQALPKDGKAINLWKPIDSGYFDVVQQVNVIVEEMQFQKQFDSQLSHEATEGTIRFKDSDGVFVEYSGQIFRGRANGYGVAKSMESNPSYEYRGCYRNNQREDQNGEMILSWGHKYKGAFQKDKRTGHGHYKWDNDDEYTGEFLDNNFTGQARHKTAKFLYEGELKNQRFHKKGRLVDYESQSTYVGEFWEGKKMGKGRIEYKDGSTYEGDFLEDLPNGIGRRVDSNGVVYEGEFRKGKAHGKGKMYSEWHLIYEGVFQDDVVEVEGISVDKDGNRLEFETGKRKSVTMKGLLTFWNGDTFDGEAKYEKGTDYGGEYGSHSWENFFMTGWYHFSNGIRIRLEPASNYGNSQNEVRVLHFELPNMAIISFDYEKMIVGNDNFVFSMFKKIELQPATFGRWRQRAKYYTPKDGTTINLKDRAFQIDERTGELSFVEEKPVVDKNAQPATEQAKPQKWWAKFFK